MSTEHPITPPPELVREWYDASRGPRCEHELATQAARWGADQELEACCEWLSNRSSLTERLRDARRPKPPSLAEQAFDALARFDRLPAEQDRLILIRALKRLQELESNG